MISEIKVDLDIPLEEDDISKLNILGRKILNIEKNLDRLDNSWRQLKHSKEQLET